MNNYGHSSRLAYQDWLDFRPEGDAWSALSDDQKELITFIYMIGFCDGIRDQEQAQVLPPRGEPGRPTN